ncbi:MAG TPA: two-component regulator propeller domain-containing protein [Acidisarcina sp.]
MNKRLRTLLLLLAVCGLAPAAHASDIGPFNYTRRVWQVQDGLAEDVVQAFAQTADRYFWIGTTAGLVRFDGAEFVTYNSRNVPALTEKSIFCLLADRDGGLWIGTEGGGLVLYRDGVFRAFSLGDGLTNAFVRRVYQDSRGTIWIGTDGGLFQVSGKRIVRVDNNANIPMLAVHAIREDAQGGIWAGGSRLVRIENGKAREYHLRGELSEYRVKSILAEKNGTVWVGTVSGLYRMPGGGGTPGRGLRYGDPGAGTLRGRKSHRADFDAGPEFDAVSGIHGTVRALWQGLDGALWIGMIGQGAIVLGEGRMTPLRSPGWLPSNTVLNFFGDFEGNIWIGTQHGMLRLSKTVVSTIPLPGAADSDFGTVYGDGDHDLWMASSRLFLVHNGTARPYTFAGAPGIRVRNVFRDRDGTLWLGTDGAGVFKNGPGKVRHFTTREGLVNNYIRAFLQSRDASIWIATDEGISHWQNGKITSYQPKDGLCYGNERAMLEDAAGDLWIGTERGISHMRGNVFLHDVATDKLQNEKVWSIHQDETGGLWFGTRTNGLYRWKSGRLAHFTTADGLVSDSIYQILEDGRHYFWMSGPDGVSRVRREDLDGAAEHGGKRLAVTLFGISQGIEMTEIYGGTQPSGFLASDGVWFPSSQGPIHISSDAGAGTEPPPVALDKVLVDGQERSFNSDLILKPNNRKIQFNYTAVSLRSPEGIRYRYKLEGFDREWTEAGAQRQVSYTNLSPGAYRFRVVAFNIADPASTTSTAIGMRQEPYFYRTPWFVICAVLISIALIWISHLRRLRELRLRFNAVLEERSRVAREMHDTLIQGCVSVSTLLEGVSSQGDAEGEERSNLLNVARAQLHLTLDDARRALWNLRRDATLSSEVGPLLFSMANEISKESHTRISCQTSGKPYSIPTAQARELLMVTREALYNSVHHSSPSVVNLRISFGKTRLGVEVADDGKGFDTEAIRDSSNGHYGLIGMRERIEKMKGEFAIESRRGSGTRLEFTVPCNPVFTSKSKVEGEVEAAK